MVAYNTPLRRSHVALLLSGKNRGITVLPIERIMPWTHPHMWSSSAQQAVQDMSQVLRLSFMKDRSICY